MLTTPVLERRHDGCERSQRDGVIEQPESMWRSPWLVAVSWTEGLGDRVLGLLPRCRPNEPEPKAQ